MTYVKIMNSMNIAIIGSGISGLGAAYLLHQKHTITLYEKNNRLGGHSRTIDVMTPDGKIPVDTGFIVYNARNYPHLTDLFKHLNVATHKSDMSFGVSIENGWLEYGSKGMFAQPRNLLRPKFWGMLADILRFNQKAKNILNRDPEISLRDALDQMRMGDWFRRYYLQAMGAAIWSCSVETILEFPAVSFIRFFDNHGLLTVRQHPQWYTVTGGSRAYIEKLTAGFRDKILMGRGVTRITRRPDGVTITDTSGQSRDFDAVVLAGHADESLKLLEHPSEQERMILSPFKFQNNHIIVHSDTSFMPKRKKCWASWIYLSNTRDDQKSNLSLSYWMNNLQNLPTKQPVLVTLNAGRRPPAHLIHDEHSFSHPIFDRDAIMAQDKIAELQGQNRTYFCGAWQRYGFHEDGLLSAVHVAEKLGCPPPWI